MNEAALEVGTETGGLVPLAQIKDQRSAIQELLRGAMKDGVDYGTIPGCGPKPTLLKPGAEKVCALFRIAPELDIERLTDDDDVTYIVKARAKSPSGLFLGEGVGTCSTKESKYRWRSAICTEEFDEALESHRRMKWGKGKTKPTQSRQVRTNPSDQENTIVKMAKKRALVDMVLTVTAASDIFTQDIEEMKAEKPAEPQVEQPRRKAETPPKDRQTTATTAKAPPQEEAPPTQADADDPGIGYVEGVTYKDGVTNGKDWRLFIVKLQGGMEFPTFEESFAKAAEDSMETEDRPAREVRIDYETVKRGKYTNYTITDVAYTA